ncbi:hypothetical protein NVP1013O_62 [Vibrio phage 1.013.O._10N.286.54.F9]|nr:hypothetical protein NVP1013O_62 [Vibrio phage 1.013.O._10N.286.54.F9]
MSDLSINAKEIIEECQMSGQAVMEIVADHGEDEFIHVADVELFSKNHDRMVEEIAELKGALKSLIGKGVDLLNVEDVIDEEDEASVHANFNDAIIKSEKLLAKLNQEGEE